MSEAISFIESRLFDELSLAAIAETVGLSPYHFHRTFQALAGEPVGEYIKKRRLDAAACMLVDGDSRIIDIAMECGFSSQEAFARAFAKAFGWPPGVFRRLKPPRKRYRRLDALGGQSGTFPPAEPRFETLPDRRVFGLCRRVVLDGYAGARTILGLWKEFCARWTADMAPVTELYGLGLYSIPELLQDGDSFEYFACAPLEDTQGGTAGAVSAAPSGTVVAVPVVAVPVVAVPAGYEERRIPGGLYAVFEYDGPARRTRDAFNYIFGEWFPSVPWRLRTDESGSIGFERYRAEEPRGTLNRVMSVYVPIEALPENQG